MRELQKYYAAHEDAHEDTGECENQCTAIYLSSEADAAFAEMRREHAEEIERLKAELESMTQEFREQFEAIDLQNERLRKQAERYEKLRRNLNVKFPQKDFAEFDALIDQLPASGEASAEVQARRTE